MSLLNANDGNKNVRTIYITKVYRNSKTESFGDSVMNDFASAMLPAAQITSIICVVTVQVTESVRGAWRQKQISMTI